MNNAGRDLEGSESGLIEMLSSNLPGTEENYEKSVTTSGIPDEI